MLRTFLLIMGYMAIRLILQGDATIAIDSSRRFRILLGVLCLPLVTVSYWVSLLDYDPCTFCAPPLNITIFLGWLVFLVTDCLYQFQMLSETVETTTSTNLV